MNLSERDTQQLADEHRVLIMQYAKIQLRCGEMIRQQAEEIARLRSQAMRQRAAIIIRDSALAWAAEDHATLESSIPGLPRRVALARRVEILVGRVQELMRERLNWQRSGRRMQLGGAGDGVAVAPAGAAPGASDLAHALHPPHAPHTTNTSIIAANATDDSFDARLEASLLAADLVICQTGCLSHGAYWRVQDHCKRTGKACVVVENTDAVRIERSPDQIDQAGHGRFVYMLARSGKSGLVD